MSEWWTTLSSPMQVFYLIAFISTIILILQLILNLVGLAGHDVDLGAGVGTNLPTDFTFDQPDLAVHGSGLGLISVSTVLAFFAGFGWGGVVLLTSGASIIVAVVVAFLIGVAFLLMVFYLMSAIFKLSEAGNIDYRNAVGQIGAVYITIPANGSGKGQVQVVVQERFRTF